MTVHLQKRPEVLGALHSRQEKPMSFVLGFRNCGTKLNALEELLRIHFGPSTRIEAELPGHAYRRTFRRKEEVNEKTMSVTGAQVTTTATLDVWENPELARYCESLPPALRERMAEWGYGTHATLQVATTAERYQKNGGSSTTFEYDTFLLKQDCQWLRAQFLPRARPQRSNDYIFFQQAHS